MQKLKPDNQISITNKAITRILAGYSISDFTFKPINEGIMNTSLIIESDGKRYVLRVYAQEGKTNGEIEFEVSFQDYLREHGIPIPLIFKNSGGTELSIVEIDGKQWQCILMEYVDGQSVTTHPASRLIAELARLQARMHMIGIEFAEKIEAPKKRLAVLKNKSVQSTENLPIRDKEVADFVGRAKKYEYVFDSELPYGFNHLDLDFDGNILTKNDKIVCIIDFDDLELSPPVMCLGYTLWNILDDEGIEMARLYMREYESVRRLTDLEWKAITSVIVFRNYMIGLVRLALWDETTPIEDIEDILKLEKEIPALCKTLDFTPLENGHSKSLEACKPYIGKSVTMVIDQPYGTSYRNTLYEANYGYIPNTVAPDGDALDAYFLGSKEPLEKVEGIVIAIVHRLEDDDDKLIVVPEGVSMTDEEIDEAVNFREKFFKHEIIK